MQNSDRDGWLEVQTRKQTPFGEEGTVSIWPLQWFASGGRPTDPFRHSASEIPFRALAFPTKTRRCPLTMIFYAPRWSLFPSFPSLRHQYFGHPVYAPMQAAP
jgi:hypothetical protein